MGWKLVICYLLVVSSVLIDSFPYPEGKRDGLYKFGNQPSGPINFQSQRNINQAWSRSQGLSQSTQNPVIVWNQVERKQNDGNNFRPANAYGYGQPIKYDDRTPRTVQTEYYPQWQNTMIPQHSTPVPINNGLSEGWWTTTVSPNSQGFYQPQQSQLYQSQQNQFYKPQQSHLYQPQNSQFYRRPYETNNYAQSYAKAYVNQGNYDQKYSQYQPGFMNPRSANANNYRLGWVPQNQYIISTPTPVEFVPWPILDEGKTESTEPTLAKKDDEPASESKKSEDFEIIPPEKKEPDYPEPIVTPQQPTNNETIVPKHYIIVHMNGTYEHVDNLDDIEVDEFYIAHLKSKEPPNQVYAIMEIEEPNEPDSQNSLENPYDTGITKIPRDARDTNDHENLGMHQSYKFDFTQTTTEDSPYDMKYFNPEYLMPIQSATENNNDSFTYPLLHTTTAKAKINDESGVIAFSTTENSVVSTTNSLTDDNTRSDSDSVTTRSSNDVTEGAFGNTINTTVDSATSASDSSTDNANINTTNSIGSTTDSVESVTVRTSVNVIDSTNASTNNTADKSTTSNVVDIFIETTQYSTADSNNDKQEYITTKTWDLPQKTQYFDNYFDYGYIDDMKESIQFTPNTELYKSQQSSKSDKSSDDFQKQQLKNYPKRSVNIRDNRFDIPGYYDEPEHLNEDDTDGTQTEEPIGASVSAESYETKKDKYTENDSENDDKPTTRKQNKRFGDKTKLREDLRVDVSELKTSVKKPVVWFRPDETFWDKVTKGEQAFDAISIYDVHCKPKLIERLTQIHHHTNGTKTVDIVEMIWDSPNDLNPKEIRSRREYRESEEDDNQFEP